MEIFQQKNNSLPLKKLCIITFLNLFRKDEMLVHEKLKDFYKGFNPNAHPMAIMCGVVGALSSFFNETDIKDPK